jgi:hypothetical protein
MLESVKDVLGTVGTRSACYARRVGDSTSALARRVGPRRGGIALGLIAAGVGTAFLVRFLRARKAAAETAEPVEVDLFEVDVVPIPETAPIGPALA